MNRLILLLLVSCLAHAANCSPGEFYATYGKNSSGWFLYDMISVRDGEEELYKSPVFYKGYEEYGMCLKRTFHDQYTLLLGTRDSKESWMEGSWVLMKGIYNNTIFKLFKMSSDMYEKPIPISYYTPILKSSKWKMSSQFEEGWKEYAFDDKSWSPYTSAVSVPESKGVYYARQTFEGMIELAAYEMQVACRFGIVVYMNGREIYRDNLPEGSILPTTVATHSYPEASFRGVIRSNLYMRMESILAIEIHPLSMTEPYELYYDAWLAQYATSLFTEGNCYISSIVPSIEGSGRFPETVYDYDITTSWFDDTPNKTLRMTFNDTTVLPDVNGLVYISGIISYKDIHVDFYSLDENHTLLGQAGLSYMKAPQAISNVFFSTSHNYTYTTIVQSADTRLGKYMLGVCNLKKGQISYGMQNLSMYMYDHYVSHTPIDDGVSNCTVTPSLPKGVQIDPLTCRLYGVAREMVETREYTVTDHTHNVRGIFSIVIDRCESVIRVYRQYAKNAKYEYFTIYNNETGEVILDDPYGKSRPDNTYWERMICVKTGRILISLGKGNVDWAAGSYVKVTKMYGEEEEILYAGSYVKVTTMYGEESLYAGSDVEWSHNDALIETTILVGPYSNWFYKYDSIPEHWNDDKLVGWEKSYHTAFPEARNQIQLYKRLVELHHLEEYISYVIHVRYQHGCIVYVNGYEVYRNHVDGEVKADSFAKRSYNVTRMRSASFPIRSMDDITPPRDFLHEGNNTIAIALVARSADQVDTSTFDCAIRLLPPSEEDRIYDSTVTYSGFMKGKDPSVLFQYYHSGFSSDDDNCRDNEIILKLKDDRREWVSHFHMSPSASKPIKTYTLYARNDDEEEWILLGQEKDIYYYSSHDVVRTWFKTSQSFNQFRIANIHGQKDMMSRCPFMVNYLAFYAHSMMDEVSDLQYPPLSVLPASYFEISPLSAFYYHHYSIQPALPEGILLLEINGMVYGRAETTIPPTLFTISAFRYSGREVHLTVTLMTRNCTTGEVLLSVYISSTLYRYLYVYEGIGEKGPAVLEVPSFTNAGTLKYGLCLPDLVYTLKIGVNIIKGWDDGSNVRLIYEDGTFVNDVVYLPSCSQKDCYRYYYFSSSYAFRNLYTEWKVLKTSPPKEWTSRDYGDSQWTSTFLPALGKNDEVTTYLRRVLNITDASYSVMNIRIGYTGGVVAYFNSRVIARYNIEANPTPHTQPAHVHSKEAYSVFHVALLHDNGEVGRNVIAIEIHRAAPEPSSTAIHFEAVGVYGVNQCSYVHDSFSSLTSTPPKEGAILNAFTWSKREVTTMPMTDATFIEWESENLEGSLFNSFGFYSGTTNALISGDLVGYDGENKTYSVTSYLNDRHDERVMKLYLADMAVHPHRKYRLQITNSSESEMDMYQFYFLYCRTEGVSCKEMVPFPAVYSGQKSPAPCDYGFEGLSYRVCGNGVFGAIHTENCRYLKPQNLTYDQSKYFFTKGFPVSIEKPTFDYLISNFSLVDSRLPDGFSLNQKTGMIYGIAIEAVTEREVVIMGSNPSGSVVTRIQINVTPARCEGDEMFPSVEVDQVATYECKQKGFYSGVLTRKCLLSPDGGKWDIIQGVCSSQLGWVGWAVGCIVLVVCVLLIVWYLKRGRQLKHVIVYKRM